MDAWVAPGSIGIVDDVVVVGGRVVEAVAGAVVVVDWSFESGTSAGLVEVHAAPMRKRVRARAAMRRMKGKVPVPQTNSSNLSFPGRAPRRPTPYPR
jgi:hypothetical protein